MSIIIGKLDCISDQRGTALKGCLNTLNQISKFILIQRGTKLNLQTDTLDISKVTDLIQSGKMVVLPNLDSMEAQTEDYTYETLGSGVKIPVRAGLYEWLANYRGVFCLSKSINQLVSRAWDLWLVDIDNKLAVEVTADGFIKGFECSLVNGENITFNDGSTSSKKPMRIQLSPSGTRAFNERSDTIADGIDFVNLDGVEDVYLNILSNKVASLNIAVVDGCDKTTVIEGLDATKYWKITNASTGSAVTPTSITFADGAYKFAGLTAGDYLFQLYDSAKSRPIVVVGTGFYKTTGATSVTITAS